MLKNKHLITIICFFGLIIFLFSGQTAEQYYAFIPPDFDGVMYFYTYYKLIDAADINWFEGIKYVINNSFQWTPEFPVLLLKDILPRNYFLFIIGNFISTTIAQLSLFEVNQKFQKDSFASFTSSFVVWLPLCLYGVGYHQATLLDGRPEIILTMLKISAFSHLFIFIFTNNRRYAILSGILWALTFWSRFNAIGYVGILPLSLLIGCMYTYSCRSKEDLKLFLLNSTYIFIPFIGSVLLFYSIHGETFYNYYFVKNVGWGAGNPAFTSFAIFKSYFEVLGRLLCSQHYTFGETSINTNFIAKFINSFIVILILFVPFITSKRSKILSICCFLCTFDILVSLLGLTLIVKTAPGQDHIFIPLLSSLLILISITGVFLVNLVNSYFSRLSFKAYKQVTVLFIFTAYLVYSLSMTVEQTKTFDRSASNTLTNQLDELSVRLKDIHNYLFLSANASHNLFTSKKNLSNDNSSTTVDYLNRLPVNYMNINASKAHTGRLALSLAKTKLEDSIFLMPNNTFNSSFNKNIEFLNSIFKEATVIITPSRLNLYNFSEPRFTLGNKDVLKYVFSNYQDKLFIIDEIKIDGIPNLILVKQDVRDRVKIVNPSLQPRIFDLNKFLE